MDEETFEIYYKYHLSICEREELLGASSHVLDILKKQINFNIIVKYVKNIE